MQWGWSDGLKNESLVKCVEGNEGVLVRNGEGGLGSRDVVVAMNCGCQVSLFLSFLNYCYGELAGHKKTYDFVVWKVVG